MSERLTPFVFDEYYHIYNRGNSKQVIYKSDSDHFRFMHAMHLSNSDKSFKLRDLEGQHPYEIEVANPLVAIGAYCLMPNHFHILLRPLVEGGVSTFMKKLSTSYSMYFNKKYERTGSLFEGRFKSQHVISDEYLKYLFSYIHLNPLKLIDSNWKERGLSDIEGGIEYLAKYRFSSYQDFLGDQRKETVLLHRNKFPDYFPSNDSFVKEIQEWVRFRDATTNLTQDRPV